MSKRSDKLAHGISYKNTVGHINLIMDGEIIRTKYFNDRKSRMRYMLKWQEEIKRSKLDREYEISIILHI